MFPRGPRFEQLKVPDVPGPNAYQVTPESQLEAYKRGAFLEKTDRFREIESDVPDPAIPAVETKKPSSKHASKPSQSLNLADRYSILQKKVDDLERVHHEGKKAHQAEVERLKHDLSRCQKLNQEQSERLDKQKKQNDVLDARVQELKKASSSDQAKIKDLRVKLRMSEHERTQISSKQGDIAEARKALQALESKRRDELRDRDRRIAELEKAAASEKKKRETIDARLQELKGKVDSDAQAARTATQSIEALASKAQAEALDAKAALESLKDDSQYREGALLEQLEQHRCLMGRVAEEYGRLAAKTVPLSAHETLKHRHMISQLRLIRVERKLANSDGQVVELAHLIRQTKEENMHLKKQLSRAFQEISFHLDLSLDTPGEYDHERDSADIHNFIKDIGKGLAEARKCQVDLATRSHELYAQFYRLKCDDFSLACSALETELSEAQTSIEQHAQDLSSALASHEAIAARLETVEKDRTRIQDELRTTAAASNALKTASASLERQIAEFQEQLRKNTLVHEATLKKEKDAVQRLATTVQKSRMAEDALRAEIEQLTSELTDAERYQEAYYSLSDEVRLLVTRNQLAEDEAQKLSQFNAEILGHHNPAQRIMYVDRIRQELAEARHKIAMLTRDHEAAETQNDDLQHELNMYRSVIVPVANKPRTNIIRVARPPLATLTRSLNASDMQNVLSEKVKSPVNILDTISADMTMDEII